MRAAISRDHSHRVVASRDELSNDAEPQRHGDEQQQPLRPRFQRMAHSSRVGHIEWHLGPMSARTALGPAVDYPSEGALVA